MNRHQQYMQRALHDVREVPAHLKDAYGSLCHRLPVLVLTNGLAITVAFLDSKATHTSDRAKWNEHDYVLRHLTGLLGGTNDLRDRVSSSGTSQYMRDTTSVLDAAVFYKRFAESILDVPSGAEPDTTAAGGNVNA